MRNSCENAMVEAILFIYFNASVFGHLEAIHTNMNLFLDFGIGKTGYFVRV